MHMRKGADKVNKILDMLSQKACVCIINDKSICVEFCAWLSKGAKEQ